jgi:hypothetical protein
MLVNTTSPRLQEYTVHDYLRCSELLHGSITLPQVTSTKRLNSEYYTEDLKYYTTKATKYYATTYAVLAYYTDA